VAVNVTDCDGFDGLSEDVTVVDVLTCTTWVNVPLLLVKPPVPVKAAVIEWLPTARVDEVKVAVPPETVTALARVVAPSVNLTVPVGVPPAEVMVAVRVMDDPDVDGFAEEVTVVVVDPPVTTCESAVLTLLAKPPVPLKVATIECVPTARAVVAKVALPAETATFDANVVAPSVKVTVPVGVPPVEVMVAVKVTDDPDADGFADELNAVLVAPWTDWATLLLLLP
jgi:hypothetical protein